MCLEDLGRGCHRIAVSAMEADARQIMSSAMYSEVTARSDGIRGAASAAALARCARGCYILT